MVFDGILTGGQSAQKSQANNFFSKIECYTIYKLQ